MNLRSADKAWIALGAAVVTYEVLADDLLSYGCDRYLEARPWLTRAVIITTAAHLLNWLPGRIDPFHGFGLLVLKGKESDASAVTK